MQLTTIAPAGLGTAQPFQLDLCVFIGRFQPFHAAHQRVVQTALEHGRHVLVLIGSAGAPRSHRNPFTYDERADMVRPSMDPADRDRIITLPLADCSYNDTQWVANAQKQVNAALAQIDLPGKADAARIALIGHSKDHSSYYLKLFPQWGTPIDVPEFAHGLSSTRIRNSYFSNLAESFLSDADGHKPGDLPQDRLLPTPVRDFLLTFAKTEAFHDIRAEYEFILNYRAQWAVPKVPYPVTFVTVDACVVTAGCVLLVRRKGRPGKGLWALPGGFLGQAETVIDGDAARTARRDQIGGAAGHAARLRRGAAGVRRSEPFVARPHHHAWLPDPLEERDRPARVAQPQAREGQPTGRSSRRRCRAGAMVAVGRHQARHDVRGPLRHHPRPHRPDLGFA